MSKLYFIGGAPRTGKTTVMQELLKRKPMIAASTDAIRAVAKGLVSPSENPKLHKAARGAFGSKLHIENMRLNPHAVLEQEIGQAEETWKSTLDFIGYYQGDGKDAAIEGVAVLPRELAKLGFEYRAVFIVDPTDQTEQILRHAREHEEDWLHKYNDDTVRLYAQFNQLWNRYYADEARRYKFPVIEMESKQFQANIELTVTTLLTS